jgi:hypothetical protein
MGPVKRKIDLNRLPELVAEGKTQAEIAKIFKVSVPAVCKALKREQRRQLPPAMMALTVKEQAFVMAKSTGLSGSEAAMRSFDCSSRDSAKSLASDLLKKPEIQAGISEWLAWHGLDRGERAKRWVQFVNSPDPGVSMTALRETSRMGRDYPNLRNEKPTGGAIYVVSFNAGATQGEPIAGSSDYVEIPSGKRRKDSSQNGQTCLPEREYSDENDTDAEDAVVVTH